MTKKFEKNQTVKFQHCDPAGIVFYPRFLEMLNELVEDWFSEELEFPFKDLHLGQGVPTADLKVSFRSPGRLGDVLTKSLFVSKLGKSSLTYAYIFTCGETVVLEGEGTLVYVGLSDEKLQAKAWPEAVAQKIELFLKS